MSSAVPKYSIVVPMRNEAGNVAALADAVADACGTGGFEAIFVDDGSSDDTAGAIRTAQARHPWLRLVRHETSGGQSAAIHSGVTAARSDVIATMDGDGQNPPLEIPRLVARFVEMGPALIAGQRKERRDTAAKKWASTAANALRSRVLRDGTRDTGCGLKVFPRADFLALPYFDHMHRYLPALFRAQGLEVHHLDVSHAAREAGTSNYSNLGRAVAGAWDIFGVLWLIRRRKKVTPTEDKVMERSA